MESRSNPGTGEKSKQKPPVGFMNLYRETLGDARSSLEFVKQIFACKHVGSPEASTRAPMKLKPSARVVRARSKKQEEGNRRERESAEVKYTNFKSIRGLSWRVEITS